MINATSREVLVDKTPKVSRQLISNKAVNTQQFSTRIDTSIKLVNEINSSNFEQILYTLIFLVCSLVTVNS